MVALVFWGVRRDSGQLLDERALLLAIASATLSPTPAEVPNHETW
jgi:hypothetical protein